MGCMAECVWIIIGYQANNFKCFDKGLFVKIYRVLLASLKNIEHVGFRLITTNKYVFNYTHLKFKCLVKYFALQKNHW